MIVFPLKWLPYLLVIGGIGSIASGEATGWGIVLLFIGAIWIYLSKKPKGVASNTASQSKTANAPAYNAPAQSATPNQSTAAYKAPVQAAATHQTPINAGATNICPSCKTTVPDDMFFCTNCGTKLR